MFGSLRSRVAQFVAAALAARGQFGNMYLPPVVQHIHGGQQQPRVDMYYASRAARLAARSKQYPYSSTRQHERHKRNSYVGVLHNKPGNMEILQTLPSDMR